MTQCVIECIMTQRVTFVKRQMLALCMNRGLRPLHRAAWEYPARKTTEYILHQSAAIKAGIKRIAAKTIGGIDGEHGARHRFLTPAGIEVQRMNTGDAGSAAWNTPSATANAGGRTARRRSATGQQQGDDSYPSTSQPLAT